MSCCGPPMCLLLLVVTLLARLALLALLLPVGCGVLGCPVQVVAGPWDPLGLRRSLSEFAGVCRSLPRRGYAAACLVTLHCLS